MKVTKKHQVYQISYMPRLFPVNCYLVEEENGVTLIDAALPYSLKSILRTVEQIGKPLTAIVLTHAHGDHVGALDALKDEFPDIPVYISKRDEKLLKGDRSLEPGEPETPIRGGVPKNITTRPDVFIEEGEKIGSLLAIETPGHTPGSMSFLDVRSNILIAGDALQTKGGIAVSGQLKPLFPFPAMATWNKEAALRSVRKLLTYKPEVLAVGHGKMIDHPIPLMEQAIHEAEKHLKQD